MKNGLLTLFFIMGLVLLSTSRVFSWTPLPVTDDPLVRMPGTQPNQVTLEGPGRCLNCHADYNHSVEPGFNWKGSMMAQSSRDFLYWTCQTVAAQDAIWAVGTPNATDICERCHFPIGWLEGRSDPTNNSAFLGDDYDGVNCDFCHTLYNPSFEDAYMGDPEGGSDWVGYWDEASQLSDDMAAATYAEDAIISQSILLFNGNPLFGPDNQLVTRDGGYGINAGGQYFNSPGAQKRSSFADPDARHQVLYSRYHKSKYFCSTCHDISNPVLQNLGHAATLPGDGTTILPTESEPSYSYYHVERTFSEFMLSDYALQGGAEGKGAFAPGSFTTSLPGNLIGKCQDCHMRDVVGVGANKRGAPLRPDESTEHPNSGLPLHDMTGGNAWVAGVLASAIPGSPNFDQVNYDLLHRPNLTLDMVSGNSNEPAAMIAGMERSKQQLKLAAAISDLDYNSAAGTLSFRVQNNTGHKLLSGFPEGRRMFVNIKMYDDAGTLIFEINPYDYIGGTFKIEDSEYLDKYDGQGIIEDPEVLGANETHIEELIYEAHPSSELTDENYTFHFALATDRYKDNRIPPKGFRFLEAQARLAEAKWDGESADDYFTQEEYTGGYDQVDLVDLPPNASYVEVSLYYQTTSREYIEFLRNEVNGTGHTTLSGTGAGGDDPYIIQSDPFFAELKGWGDTLWGLWVHNKDKEGAAPFLMAQASSGTFTPPGSECSAPVPVTPALLSTDVASGQVTVHWNDVHTGDSLFTGYNVYYDQAGKSQFLEAIGLDTSFTDTGLVNGQQYCYKVTSNYSDCEPALTRESDFSNILCAIPEPPGQVVVPIGVEIPIETGYYTGKGKNLTFVFTTTFSQGDEIFFQAYVVDNNSVPVEGATVEFSISGPSSATITTEASDAIGMVSGSWKTSSRKNGTPTGVYTASITGITATGYQWDGLEVSTGFTLQ